MTVITMQIRMLGEAQGCKEAVAMELERNLRKIGWAEVRCISAVEAQEWEQGRMEDRR